MEIPFGLQAGSFGRSDLDWELAGSNGNVEQYLLVRLHSENKYQLIFLTAYVVRYIIL